MKVWTAELRETTRGTHAYTIAELCISTMLVLTVSLGLYGGLGSGFAYTQALRENLRATQVMLERMEGIRLYSWSQLNSNGFVPTAFTAYYYPNAEGTNVGVLYTGSVTISSVNLYPPASYSPDMRQITVRVGWLTGSGDSTIVRRRSMRTYVGRNGMQNYIYHN